MNHFTDVLGEYWIIGASIGLIVFLLFTYRRTYRRVFDSVSKQREEQINLLRQQTALLERIAAAVEKRD